MVMKKDFRAIMSSLTPPIADDFLSVTKDLSRVSRISIRWEWCWSHMSSCLAWRHLAIITCMDDTYCRIHYSMVSGNPNLGWPSSCLAINYNWQPAYTISTIKHDRFTVTQPMLHYFCNPSSIPSYLIRYFNKDLIWIGWWQWDADDYNLIL